MSILSGASPASGRALLRRYLFMLDAFLNALSAVFVLVCVAGLGWYSSAKGWYDEAGKRLVSKIVGLAIPFFLFYSITSKFTHAQLLELLRISGLPFMAFAVYIVTSWLICKAGLVRDEWHGTFIAEFSGSSLLFVGIPVTYAMFGDRGIPYLLVYFFANVIFVWTIGLYNVQLDGVRHTGKPAPKFFSRQSLKMIFTKPLIGFLIGVLCVAIDLKIPQPISLATRLIGQICSPLALIFIGITVQQIGFARFKHLPRETWIILFGCNVYKPLVMFLISQLLVMDPMMRQILILSSVMPVSPMLGVLAKLHDGPADFASATVGVTVAALTFTLPVIMVLVSFVK